MTNFNRNITVIMILSATGLLQYHSIIFWYEHTGQIGVLWSLSLEGFMLFLWYEKRLPLLKWVAIGLLIFGPWYEISKPVVSRMMTANINAQQIEHIKSNILSLEKSLITFQENSKLRTGWAPLIKSTSEELKNSRAELSRLIEESKSSTKNKVKFISILILISQALIALIAISTQIYCIVKLREITKDKTGAGCNTETKAINITRPQKKQKAITDTDYDEKIRYIISIVNSLNIPGYEIAKKLGIRECDVTYIKNHDERLARGLETLSKRKTDNIFNELTNISK